ncbi:hypothetical protein PVT01_000052100 [Plasmodium vivax]|uniref:VIR protein n=1 Tax=Plasmodium vivax TaxID=5855 RepID=A0A1G4EJ37_PLAVI|nr:hypothetical protein PVT01_000052100 [Plasmodium vivax]
MPCVKQKSKYEFCKDSPYYQEILEYVEKNNSAIENEINCNLSTTTLNFSNDTSAEKICKEFKFLYKTFHTFNVKKTKEEDIYTHTDCDFLNYWLNDKLKQKVIGGTIDVNKFYKEIKSKDEEETLKYDELGKYMNNIDLEILKNMKLLYELFYYERKILNMLLNHAYAVDDKKPCSHYTDNCYKTYTAALNRCLDGYKEFCKVLKHFKNSYNFSIREEIQDKNNCRKSDHFLLPEQDPVLEIEKKEAMRIQNLTSPLIVLLVTPLIYKFTPVGPFLQEKIKKVKNMWKSPKKNKEKMLSSSMDIENNISDNRKYKLAYNSVTNE